VFERLGRRRDVGLDQELFGILQEQGLRHEDQFDQVVARAAVVDLDSGGVSYAEATRRASRELAVRVGGDAEELARRFTERTDVGAAPVANGVPMPYVLLSGVDGLDLAIVRSRDGIRVPGRATEDGRSRTTHALVFLAGDEDRGGQVLRVLAQFADHVVRPGFAQRWRDATDEQEVKEALLADERMVAIHVTPDGVLDGAMLRDLDLPPSCLVALIRRGDRVLVPRGSTTLHARDRLTVIGDPAALRSLTEADLR
jgi:basic amino acid/polyamine antiporter, APA family